MNYKEKIEEIFRYDQHGLYQKTDFQNEMYTHIIEQSILKNQNSISNVNNYKQFSKAHHELGYDLNFQCMGKIVRLEIKSIADYKMNEWINGTYRFKYFDKDCKFDSKKRQKSQGTTIDLSFPINYPNSVDFVLFFEYMKPHSKVFGYKLLKILTPDEIITNSIISNTPINSTEPIGHLKL